MLLFALEPSGWSLPMSINNRWFLAVLLLGWLLASTATADDDEEVVKVGDIVAAMMHNHAAADERFVGKELRVQGIAVDVKRLRKGDNTEFQYKLTMDSELPGGPQPGTRKTVEFVFPAKARNGLTDIKRGSIVILTAKCQANDTNGELQLWFDDAKLLRIIDAPARSVVAPTFDPYTISPDGPRVPMSSAPAAPTPFLPPMR